MAQTRYISPWIFTTTNCNLNCGYCYVKREDKYMTDETYKKINETFLEMLNTDKTDMVIYRVAGGEPLLAFDKWKRYMQEFKDKAKDKGFISLITNLTILTDEMVDFFKQNNVGFGISLDGYSFSKPFISGESSADIVMSNIDKLMASGIRKNIDISTVIDAKSFNDVDKLAKWVAERNLNWGVYLDHFFCGEMELETIVNKMVDVINILSEYKYDIFNKFKFNNIKVNSLYEGCTAGEKLITIDVNGNIFPCQTTIYDEPICSLFDNIDMLEELKKQNKYKLGYNFTLPTECEECSIASICGGGCKMHNKEINKNYTCDIMKLVILYMLNKTIKTEE